jgi:hypothetical protein
LPVKCRTGWRRNDDSVPAAAIGLRQWACGSGLSRS